MIRPARDDDYAAFATLFGELGVPEPVPVFERWRSELLPTTHVAERDGRVVGYIDCYALADTGYVRNLVVAPDVRNAGVGAALMHAGAAWLRARGLARWNLNVKETNAAARRLYEKLGLAIAWRAVAMTLQWEDVARLPAEPADVWPVEAADAAMLERRFDLLAGRLANGRAKPGRVAIQLRADCEPVGLALFDPTFPGANVVCVARPGLIGTLLGALRPHGRHAFLRVVIEKDEAVGALLEAHGAEVHFRLLQMAGEIPAVTDAHG